MPPKQPKGPVLAPSFDLKEKEFETIRKLVKEKTGISLGLHKRDLVVSRLARRLRALNLSSFSSYIEVLESPSGSDELVQMINRITTNKTEFFRENHHFEFLKNQALPEVVAGAAGTGGLKLRAWSAGCSSGEEPFSIGLTLLEFFANQPGGDLKLLASDLDTTMLAKASAGIYEAAAMEPVPKGLLHKYFDRVRQDGELFYRVRKELRSLITFRKFNLMHPTYPFKVQLDFIFCRNVLIYFDPDDKVDILTKFHQVLKPGGYIFVGHSESLMMVKDLFRYKANTVYQKV
jgi:chemotaxis protein methyltransferase CheR